MPEDHTLGATAQGPESCIDQLILYGSRKQTRMHLVAFDHQGTAHNWGRASHDNTFDRCSAVRFVQLTQNEVCPKDLQHAMQYFALAVVHAAICCTARVISVCMSPGGFP
jgi:hypothetical protein